MKLSNAKRFASVSLAFFGAVLLIIGLATVSGNCVDYTVESGKVGTCTTDHPLWLWSVLGGVFIALAVRLWLRSKK